MGSYWALLEEAPHLFSEPKDAAFSVMTDLTSIRMAEEAAAAELRAVGSPAAWATVGVMFEDQYFLLLRDAVRFPDGSLGTYIRITSRNPDSAGVAILPLLEEKVVLVRHYRHATQSWHLEIPRGFPSVGMTSEEQARAEIAEEIGGEITTLRDLGIVHPDTGISSGRVHMYLAHCASIGEPEVNEGISDLVLLEVHAFEELLAAGEVSDAFTLAAFCRARTLGFL